MTAGEKLRLLELCKDEPIVLRVDGDNLLVNAGGGKTKLVAISDVLGDDEPKTRIPTPLSRIMMAIDKVEEGTNFAEFRKRLSAEAQKQIKLDWIV